MGKYMRKSRGGAVATTQGPLGVRTRARAQAMQELLRDSSNDGKITTSTSMQSLAPAQISYLELRSRRLEKVVGCMSNKPPTTRKSTSATECRRLSDLTNSDILADDSSPHLALSIDEARYVAQIQGRHQILDENQEFLYHFHGENEVDTESSLQSFVRRSLQQGANQGRRTPPGVAHSRSNSRSNSVTRELPVPREPPPRGILTRNQRKLEKRTCDTMACSNQVDDMEVDVNASSNRRVHGLATLDVDVSCGENPMEDSWSAGNRLTREETPSTREGNAMSSTVIVKVSRELECAPRHEQGVLSTTCHSSLNMEIEDFFSQAEQKARRNFIERYNFDPKTDTPLQGRFEWIEL